MHVIYHCVNGCHSSAIAAAMHLNLLPMDYKPSLHDITNIPFFDNLQKKDSGKIIYRGTDEKGNKIYTLCREYAPHIILPALLDFWEVIGQNKNDLLLVNTQTAVNRTMKIGDFMSKKLKIVNVGKPIVTKGTLYAYRDIANIVKNTKMLIS